MRLTKRDRGGNARQNCDECEIKFLEGCCSKLLCRNALIQKLAAYEDAGLTPEDIFCIRATQRITPERLAEIVRAEFDGRLVILPCKVGDTVWFYLYENRGGIRKGVYQGIITELKAVQRLNRDTPLFLAIVRFEYPDPWYSFKQLSTSEMYCSFGEYGSWVQFYLTREEAEAALKGEMEEGSSLRCTGCWCETNWDNFSAEEALTAWNRRADNGTT